MSNQRDDTNVDVNIDVEDDEVQRPRGYAELGTCYSAAKCKGDEREDKTYEACQRGNWGKSWRSNSGGQCIAAR